MELFELEVHEHKPDKSTKLTSQYMTRYEYSECLSYRAILIAAGHPPLVDCKGIYDPIEIAKQEILSRKVPLVIVRTLPNGTKERWAIKDMNIRDY